MIIQEERPQSHIVATQCAYKSVKLHILRTTTKPEEVIKNIDCSRRRRRSHDSETHSREAGLQDCSDASTGQYWQILQFTVKNRYVCMQIALERTHTHRVTCLWHVFKWACQQCRVYRKADVSFAFTPKALTSSGKCMIAVSRMKPDIGEEILWTVTWLVYSRGHGKCTRWLWRTMKVFILKG